MNRSIKTWVILGLVLSTITLSCKKEIRPDNETTLSNQNNNVHSNDLNNGKYNDILSNSAIIEWNILAFEAAGGVAEAHPTLASRIEAMMHIAIHDALNAIVPVYGQYAYHQQNALADPFAAVASAAHTVLKASWPDFGQTLDDELAESLSNIPDGPGKTEGIALGIASGNAILALRAGDGAFQNPVSDWPASTVPGVYIKVPPNDFVYAPFWGTIPVFSLQTSDQFRPSPPPALNSPSYARAFNEVKEVGEINSTVRTADETAYANWWFELADIGWNRIARIQATSHNTGLYATARMFALLNMAMADGYIACWEAKYFYNFWRPYTAIRAAASDGNDRTLAAPNWEPLIPTPPVPDYPSGHSVVANAAATVLAYFFGNHSPFSMTSITASPAGAVRSFDSFKKAADENADSRVKVGIHFRFACDAGQKQGDEIGKWTVKNHLEPLH
jgi:membrane-associated phospholipid phosphatase